MAAARAAARRIIMTLPKYKFLAQTLRKELLGGVYHSGDALPTEQTLARSYAKTHARRGVVLFDCHESLGEELKIGDRLIMDIFAA